MDRFYKLVLFTGLIGLVGCAGFSADSYPPLPAKHETPSAQSYLVKPPPVEKRMPASTEPSAVIALMEAAEIKRRSGHVEAAVSSLERAIKIQPRNAGLWQRMAELRLEQYKPWLALDLARKSNALASGNRALKARNRKLIAEAQRLLGKPEAALKAEEGAARLVRE
jgi:tetratricopeptide (TPR) repeat protein